MKKITLSIFSIVFFGFAITQAIIADFQLKNPGNFAAPVVRSSEYLPASLEGYIRVVPANGIAYVVHESELWTQNPSETSVVCIEIFPAQLDDYYRVLSLNQGPVVVHEVDLEAHCNISISDHQAIALPSGDLIPCNRITLIIPTNDENYYRLLDEDANLYVVHKNELAQSCDLITGSSSDDIS